MVRITNLKFVLKELTSFREIKRKCMEAIKENTNFPDTNRRAVSLLALHLFWVAIFICWNPGAHPHVNRSTGTWTPHLKTHLKMHQFLPTNVPAILWFPNTPQNKTILSNIQIKWPVRKNRMVAPNFWWKDIILPKLYNLNSIIRKIGQATVSLASPPCEFQGYKGQGPGAAQCKGDRGSRTAVWNVGCWTQKLDGSRTMSLGSVDEGW